ncbi:hypothetical protein Y1Q_0021779 [Alligator mississippiensis]|uniref:Uncharacterized protein n=1 Tax=Alligator mississippiensis TaxID=8496 RepID=A0A151PB36_ALLMI|nr:hypothetical protein Y1Q_0021779 [Alligator mississippiensis]
MSVPLAGINESPHGCVERVLEPTFVGCCLHKCLTYYIGNVPGKNLEGTHRSLSKQLFVRRFLYLTELGKARI